MKKIWREIGQGTSQFKRHWLQYLALFISVDLIIQLLWIPIFRLVTTFVLQAGEIPFVSYQNIVTIIREHPLVVLVLLVELLLVLVVIYWQFAFILLGVRDISREMITVRGVCQEAWQCVRRLHWASLFVLLVYFVLVIPFADLVFRTPLLAKVQVPQFILDYLTRSGLLLTLLIIFYLLMIFLGVRLVYALPLMVYRGQQPRTALASSWQRTRKMAWWPVIARLLTISIVAALVMAIFYATVVGAQWVMDVLPHPIPYLSANLNLLLVQFGSEILTTWTGVLTINLLFRPLLTMAGPNFTPSIITRGVKRVVGVGLALLALVTVISDGLYLNGSENHRPVTVSHRGVADKNGVQNSIAAMEKTHRLHPDYVEMDLHETKDHQFVVLHDENLKQLTGVNKRPSQLTLKQLTRLTARENGHSAKIASFDDYLRVANRLHQKLLVEVKTTPYDSPDMLRRFDRRYGNNLVQHHAKIHSLDYSVVQRLKKIDPRLYVMYIQPYNFTYPNIAANGYSMEYSTLTYDFITLAHLQGKQVYSWTVNNPNVMKQLMYKNADGIITDNMVELNRAVAQYESHGSYARKILNYIMVVPTSTEFAP